MVGIYDGVHQTPDYQDSGIMFLSVENIATLKSEKYISEEAFERDYNVYPEKGDILMTRIGDVGTTNVVETAEKVAFYVSLALLKPNGIDSYFLSNAMKTNDFQKGLRERTLVTAIPQKINKDEIGKINIFITNNDEEQKKIGAYFSSLDHLITLHQRKNIYFYEKVTLVWEQRKLGEVFKEYSEKGHTELPTLTIIQGGGTVKREDSDRNLMYDETNLSNYKMVRKDDFIVHLRSFEGGLEKASLDGIISPAYHTFHSDEADSRFYYPYFRSFEFIKHKLVPHVYGIRDGRSIDIEGMKSIEIPYTSLSEQRKIGDYLELLDHLITLHQRKCEETKKLKKYMLQKMFPQNGQTVPEIRFAGFTDAWEQRKLGKLVDRVTRKNQDLVSELPLTISAQYGLIDQNEFFDKRVASKDVSGYYLIENGEFAYNKSTSTDAPWGAVKRLDRYENGVLSTLYIVFGIKENNPVDSDFLVSYYSTNLWHKGIHEIAAEGARNHGLLNIAPADFFETELTMPQDIEEQKKIGKYFEELERLITLHQCKCHLLLKLLHNDWEQRKLGEIASSFEYGLNAAAKEYDGENKYIRITDIDDNTHEFLTYNLTSPDIDLTDVENYKLAEGDILFARTGASVGKSYIYRDSDGLVYYAGFLIRARIREEYDAEFVFQSMLTDKYNKYIAVTSQRSGQPGVNAQEYSEFEIRVPEKEEQTKIGTYFHNLDHLITLHHRKYIYILKSP